MPLYEFVCTACGRRFEELTTIAGRESVRCPDCGAQPERLYEGKSAFGVGAIKNDAPAHCDGCCQQCPHHHQ